MNIMHIRLYIMNRKGVALWVKRLLAKLLGVDLTFSFTCPLSETDMGTS